jgi:MFS family permease
MLGVYNVVWAGGAAVAYFTGGVLLEALGGKSLFWLPALLHLAQLFLTRRLQRQAAAAPPPMAPAETPTPADLLIPDGAKNFLRLAWVANPFAYIAMNTLIPVIPSLAAKMNLSTALAGFVASVWMFARLFAFLGLWLWPGWHYRLGWLVGAYGLMVLSFAAVLLVPNLAVIVIAQLVFGLAVGLIYYSSLFYSMDVGDTKGEHGGFHEALIGVGLFAGPAVGAGTLQLNLAVPNAGIWAVSGLLVVGLIGLLRLRRTAGSRDRH